MTAARRLLNAPPSPMSHLLGTPRDSQHGLVRFTELLAHQRSQATESDEFTLRRRLQAAQVQRGVLLDRMGRRFSGWDAEVVHARQTPEGLYLELVAGAGENAFVLSNEHPEPPRGFCFALPPGSVSPLRLLTPGRRVRADGVFLSDRESRPLLQGGSPALGLYLPCFLVRFDMVFTA